MRIVILASLAALSASLLVLFIRSPSSLLDVTSPSPLPQREKSIAVSRDGAFFAMIRNDATIEILQASGTSVGVVRGHGAPVISVAFLSNEVTPTILTVDQTGEVITTRIDSLSIREVAEGSAIEGLARPIKAASHTILQTAADLTWQVGAGETTMQSANADVVAPIVPSGVNPPLFGMFRDCAACPEMVRIEASSRPSRFVASSSLQAYNRDASFAAIGRFPISRREWDFCVVDAGCPALTKASRSDSDPVTNITWQQASNFAAWLSSKTGRSYKIASSDDWLSVGETRDPANSTAPARSLIFISARGEATFGLHRSEWLDGCGTIDTVHGTCASKLAIDVSSGAAPPSRKFIDPIDMAHSDRGFRVAAKQEHDR